MEIVYWAPDGKVERIYFNIPRQRLVEVWMEPVQPSQQYRWDYRIKVATNAFRFQPELRRKVVQAVVSYMKHQTEQQLKARNVAQSWSEVTWALLIESRERIETPQAERPAPTLRQKAVAAFATFGQR